jgi:hypothetical protein
MTGVKARVAVLLPPGLQLVGQTRRALVELGECGVAFSLNALKHGIKRNHCGESRRDALSQRRAWVILMEICVLESGNLQNVPAK